MYTHVYTFDMTYLHTLHNNKHIQCNNKHTYVCAYSCILYIYIYIYISRNWLQQFIIFIHQAWSSEAKTASHTMWQVRDLCCGLPGFGVGPNNDTPKLGAWGVLRKLWNKLKKTLELWQTFISSDFSYTSYVLPMIFPFFSDFPASRGAF
jgi:hypothetical protein